MNISLFVLGDSISIHYGPWLRRSLGKCFSYNRKGGPEVGEDHGPAPDPANGRDSVHVLSDLEERHRGGFTVDVLLVNCGLHDLRQDFPGGPCQVCPEEYQKNLVKIVAIGKQIGRQFVWVRTTPLQKDFASRTNQNVDLYNTIADEVMAAHHIPVIDLHSVTKMLGAEVYTDPTHFQIPARQIQGAHIGGYLQGLAQNQLSQSIQTQSL